MNEHAGVATHSHGGIVGYWSLSAASKEVKQRVYVGLGEPLVFTVGISNPIPPGTAAIEVLVNGSAVPAGVVRKRTGPVSRTWKFKAVKTIDIKARQKNYMSGRYVISVPL